MNANLEKRDYTVVLKKEDLQKRKEIHHALCLLYI